MISSELKGFTLRITVPKEASVPLCKALAPHG